MAYLSDLPKTFVILGVHRSGTSFLCKALTDAGVAMDGQAIHYEDNTFVQLNKAIIQGAGGTWRIPPGRADLSHSGAFYTDPIQHAIERKRAQGDLVGWKDPRQALTIESYLPHLDGDTYLIAIFRKPEKAGASLRRLGQMNEQMGTALAREYDRRIVEAIRRFVDI